MPSKILWPERAIFQSRPFFVFCPSRGRRLTRPLVSRPFIIYLQPDVGGFERAAPPMYLAPHELIYNAESRAKIESVLQVSESSSSIFSLSLWWVVRYFHFFSSSSPKKMEVEGRMQQAGMHACIRVSEGEFVMGTLVRGSTPSSVA